MNHNYLSIESIIPDFIVRYDVPDETTDFVSKVKNLASHNPDHYNYISSFKDKCLEEIELNSSDEEKCYYKYMFSILTDDLFEALYYDESKRPYYLYGLKCFLEELPHNHMKISKHPSKFQQSWFDASFSQLKSALKKETNFFKIGKYITEITNYIMRHEIYMVYDELVELIDEFVDEDLIDKEVFESMMDNYQETYLRFISNFTNVWRTYRYRQEFIRDYLLNKCTVSDQMSQKLHSEIHLKCSLANNQDGLLSRLSYRDEMAYFINNCLNFVSDNISSSGLPLLPFIFAKTGNILNTSNVNNYLVNLEYMYFMDDNYQFIKDLPKDHCKELSRDYYTKTLNFCLMSDKFIDSFDEFEFGLDDDEIMISINSYVLLNYSNDDGVNHQEKALMLIKEYIETDDDNEFFMKNDKKDFIHYIEILNKRCVRINEEDYSEEIVDELPTYTTKLVENKKEEVCLKPLYDNFLIDAY